MRQAILIPMLVSTVATSAHAWDSIRGNGEIVTETRTIAEFTELSAAGGLQIELRRGAPSLVIETDRNLLPYVRSEVKEGRLSIGPKSGVSLRSTKALKVVLTTPTLSSLEASGGVSLTVDVPLTKTTKIETSGGVKLHMTGIDVEVLDVEASGGVELNLAGKAAVAKLELSGGVEVRAAGLSTETIDLDASGGCSLDLAASEAVKGDISGGVSVEIHGSPKVSISKSGGASVRLRDSQ